MSNKNTPDEMIACIQAWQRGEKIEYLHSFPNEWRATNYPEWNFGICAYRIAPKPKEKNLRPWKPEEVPVGALVQDSTYRPYHLFMITCSIPSGVALGTGAASSTLSFDSMLKNWKHSTDGGKTWKPCGVEVEE